MTLPDAARHLGWIGATAFAGCDDGSVMALNNHQASHCVHRLGEPVTALAVSGDRLAVGALDGSAIVISRPGDCARFNLGDTVRAAAITGDRAIFAAGTDLCVRRGAEHDVVQLGIGPLTTLTQVTGNLVIAGGVKGIAWFDVSLLAHDGQIELPTILATSTDPLRRFVAAGDLGGSVHVLRSGANEATELTGYPDRVALLDWLAAGTGLCASADDELTVWRATDDGLDEPEPVRLLGHERAITALASSPTIDLVATGDAAGGVCVWSPLSVDAPVARLRVDGVVLAIAWSHNGRELLISTSTGLLLRCAVVPGAIA